MNGFEERITGALERAPFLFDTIQFILLDRKRGVGLRALLSYLITISYYNYWRPQRDSNRDFDATTIPSNIVQ